MVGKGFFVLDERSADLRRFFEEHPEIAAPFERTYLMSWLYHENALDGLVLTEEEITLALEHHVVAEPSAMNVISLVRAHRKALARIEAEAQAKRGKITIELLEELYQTLLEGGRPTAKKAVWRQEIPLHRTYLHDLLPPEEIQGALEKWARRLRSSEFREKHPIQQAASAHWHFMQVFPFAEHNGRIGRLIQAFYLLRAGFRLPVMHATSRQAYYQSLRKSSSDLADLLVRSMEESLENCIRYLRSLQARRAG